MGEKYLYVRETLTGCFSHAPTWTPGHLDTNQACVLTKNRTSDLSVCETVPNPLKHTSPGCNLILKSRV